MDLKSENANSNLPRSPSFYRSVYSEIEEVGWEHLVKLSDDLAYISFRVLDSRRQSHTLEIQLPQSYPICAPSISADVPYLCELHWSTSFRLKDVVHQFHEHLENLQEFWATLDNIDNTLLVVHPGQPSRAASFRQIQLGNECFIVFSINIHSPSSLPECRFLGPNSMVDSLRKTWRRNSKQWMKDIPFSENLARVLELSLPKSACSQNQHQVECGICYAQHLPVDDELGANSGSSTDYTCDNSSCNRDFHSVCLADWLRSITTTRQSFDVLFGNCPYCSEPVAVKVNTSD